MTIVPKFGHFAMMPLFTIRRLFLFVALIAATLSGYQSYDRSQQKRNVKREAKEAAEFLRNGYYTRPSYPGLERTSEYEESKHQRELSKRLLDLTRKLTLADSEALADYIEHKPLDYKKHGNRGHWRREEGARHAVAFRSYAIHSPAQRRTLRTRDCKNGDIRNARSNPEQIRLLAITDQQLREFDRINEEYKTLNGTTLAKRAWIGRARWAVYTPEQHKIWRRMGEEDGPPPDPPNLSSTEIPSTAELERLSPVFKTVRVQSSLNLSKKQKESFAEFTEIVQTGIQWIEQFEYPELYFPNDPSFDSEDPIADTIAEAMLQADQYVLLKILTAEQYDQLVPNVLGEREEFPRRNIRH